jgi:hypothetical protein
VSQHTRPVEIRIEPLAPEEEVFADVSREAIALAAALNGVRPFCDEIACALVVPGAIFDQPMTLTGERLGDYILLPDGSLNVVDQTVIERNGCEGCFAERYCIGGLRSTHTRCPLPGSARCHLAREVSKETLLNNIARGNGVAWKEAPAPHAATLSW